MIEILEKKDCCGCEACENVCSKSCISMIADEEGFSYPQIDKSKCINCNLCEKVCPILKTYRPEIKINGAYVVQNKNKQERDKSTSGGFFSIVSNYVLENNGKLYSATFDENMEVQHKRIKNKSELEKARGSKYVQSKIGFTYKSIKKELEQDDLVCFSGTPCQVEGLKNYLGKVYDNLITIGVVCHGVPSPKVWKKYISEVEKEYKSKLNFANFRDKSYGYNRSGMKLYFKDKCIMRTPEDMYLRTFFAEICSRPSCYSCKFKQKERVSDFTIFDAWHAEDKEHGFDSQGATNVFLYSSKSVHIFDKLKENIVYKEIDVDSAIQADGIMVLNSAIENKNRSKFFDDLDNYSLKELQKLYFPLSNKDKIKFLIKDILNKIGLLKILYKPR